MYLEEVVLDGFKSYATRTVVGPFHHQFNAISGLNGTGKSNILDSICFVMGIKSLQQMRVSKTDELIYKQGQAGVTKASVTLVFRNEDRKSSPLGMAEHSKITITRQIAVGGRDRLLLNGHTARPSDIQTLFQSVQLNVNNPHFLVMQGRITKVTNMKPPEILGLVEEAAGTRIYETKRSESMRKIIQKESKLSEIDSVIKEEIEPTLQNLRKEQENYTAALRGAEELSRLERFCLCFDFWRVTEGLKKLKADHDSCNGQKADLLEAIAERKQRIGELEGAIQKEISGIGQSDKQLLLQYAEEKKSFQNKLTIANVATEEAKKAKKRLEEELRKLSVLLETSKTQHANVLSTSKADRQAEETKKASVESLKNDLTEAMTMLEELRTGHCENKTAAAAAFATTRQKLVAAEVQLKNFESEAEQLRISMQQWEADLKAQEGKTTNKQSSQVLALTAQLEEQRGKLAALTLRVERLGPSKAKLAELENRRRQLEEEITSLEDQAAQLRRKTYPIQRFHQENPGVPKEGVEGLALELLHVLDNRYTLALEEAGKSRLLNIVVRNEEVAKRMLEKYRSMRRITCIPMTKIRSNPLPMEVTRKAIKANHLPEDTDEIRRPLDVIKPRDNEYLPSLAYVFGQALLCTSSSVAETISRSVRCLAITTKGDQYNPTGSVSGGSSAGLEGLLACYERLVSVMEEDKQKRIALQEVRSQLQLASADVSTIEGLARDRESTLVAVEGLTKRLADISSVSGEERRAKKRLELTEARERYKFVVESEIPRVRDAEIPALRADIDSNSTSREDKIKALEGKVRPLKTKLKAAEKDLATTEEGMKHFSRDLIVLEKQIASLESQITTKTNEDLKKIEADIVEAVAAEQSIAASLEKVSDCLVKAEAEANAKSKKHNEMAAEKSSLESAILEDEAKIKLATHSMQNLRQTVHDYEKRRAAMMRDHGFLKDLIGKLGVPNSDYDFTKPGASNCQERLSELQRQVERLQKNLNRNVVTVLQNAEQQLEGLHEKRSQLVREKQKLEEFIDELDVKKQTALNSCWREVDSNLSAIFSSVLPSCCANLVLANEKNISEGLEMRVSLSGVQKASLGELSGGQRSLLALSLVLALLRFKPAPLYILDEIDAALDLSHTQRIGQMIRSQFQGSQFIIVSLKENLFNYADVLFRTNFAGGSSQVKRSTNSDGSR